MTATTALDKSGNGNTGTLINGPQTAIGRIGQALEFDGVDDYVVIPYAASLNLSNDAGTIAAWFKMNNRPVRTITAKISFLALT